MKTRIQQFITAENISQSQFADTINVARGSVSHIISGRNKPSYEFLQGMIEHYPMINVEWLLTGKGKMYKDVTKLKEQANVPDNLFSGQTAQDNYLSRTAENAVLADSTSIPEQKMQPERVENPSFPAQPSDNKKIIEKIVVFYTNGTFEEFTH